MQPSVIGSATGLHHDVLRRPTGISRIWCLHGTPRQHPGIDIANHLIAASSSRRPETCRESFAILSDEGLIPEDLATRLPDPAGFRDLLVHLSCRPDEVSMVLRDDLPVANRYREVLRNRIPG